MGSSDHNLSKNHQCTDRNVIVIESPTRLFDRLAHELGIVHRFTVIGQRRGPASDA